MDHENRISHAALSTLIGLQAIMLASLFAQTPPHPPLSTPLFAMAPFLAASISLAIAGLVLGAATSRLGTIVSIIATVSALISFGPQKWFDAAIPQIWPAVLLGQIAAVAVFWSAYRRLRDENQSA